MISNKEELIQKAYDLGFQTEKDYGGCGQCTLIGILGALEIDNPILVKSATGLAGGGARMCDGVCGGYAGGSMAMASIFGRRLSAMDADLEDKTAAYESTAKLRTSFLQEYGSVICGNIHKKLFDRNYNMWSQVEMDQFNADGAHTEKCTGVVGKAAAAAVRIILEEADKRGMSLEDIRKKAAN